MKRINTAFIFVIALLLFIGILISLNGNVVKNSSQQLDHFKRDALPGEEVISAALGELENMYEQLELAKDDLDMKSFSVEAVEKEIGSDKLALYNWVKNRTLLVPYRGMLRGARGVLLDRLGNSLDRALLLYDLLYEAGYDVRLARGILTEEKSVQLLQKLRKLSQTFSFPKHQDEIRSLMIKADKFASKYQIDSRKLKQSLKSQRKKQEQVLNEIGQRSNHQAEAMISAIKKAGAIKSSDEETAAKQALQEHWWVQVNEDEDWMDLDPSLPEFNPGQILISADDYCDPDDLNEQEFHTINIRLVIEQFSSGKVSEKTVLTYTLKPYELAGKHITLRHYPLDWPKDENLLEAKELMDNLKKVIRDQKSWIPTLIVDSDEIQGAIFDHTGELIKKKKRSGGMGGFSQSMFKAFGAKQKKEKPKPNTDTYLTAEWIEYEICSPGQPVRTLRREIFDLLGPAERVEENTANTVAFIITSNDKMERCLSLLGQTEILILTSCLSEEFIEYLSIENLFLNEDLIIDLFPMVNEAEPRDVLAQIAEISSMPEKLYDAALARSKLRTENKLTFLSHPNIFSFHSKLKAEPRGEFLGYRGLDIVENNVEVLDGETFSIRLKQGVLDTNTEALIINSRYEVLNTSEVFRESSDWIILTGLDRELFEKIEINHDTKQLIRQDLERGYIVIIPKKTVKINGTKHAFWWRVDPATGHTLGMGQHGWGQAITEYAEVAQTMIQLKLQIESYMGLISCLMNTAAYALASEEVSTELKHAVGKCIWDTVCNYMMGKITGYFLADTIWSNFIVEKTVDWITGNLCGID